MDVEEAVKSRQVLAIDCDVYLNNKCEHAILCITVGILVMLYKKSKGVVINPLKFNDVLSLFIADNVPSAGAL